MKRSGRVLLAAASAALLASACTTLDPVMRPNRFAVAPSHFSHEAFDRVLREFVGANGLVDYAGLARRPFDLESYVGAVAGYSPDSHPALFPTREDRLAYWINAYNAVTIWIVLAHHPVGSVMDVVSPWATPLLPRGAGFFFGHRFPVGGDPTNLLALEHRVVRKRFVDARYHFALNCASLGCPALPAEAFDPRRLDSQLARETDAFLSEPRNLRIDPAARTVRVSRILDDFADDFHAWQEARGAEPHLLAFVADHLADPDAADAVRRADAAGFAVEALPYDWRLNDRGLGPRPALSP